MILTARLASLSRPALFSRTMVRSLPPFSRWHPNTPHAVHPRSCHCRCIQNTRRIPQWIPQDLDCTTARCDRSQACLPAIKRQPRRSGGNLLWQCRPGRRRSISSPSGCSRRRHEDFFRCDDHQQGLRKWFEVDHACCPKYRVGVQKCRRRWRHGEHE